jgi:hypothetical protein
MLHSLAEAYLYAMVTPCSACGEGPLVPTQAPCHEDGGRRILFSVACRACGARQEMQFDGSSLDPDELPAPCLREPDTLREMVEAPAINSGSRPSQLIDVPGWLTLYALMMEAARHIADPERAPGLKGRPTRVRQVQIAAARCLEEALKFYDRDNDLPPEEAFFGDDGRRQFRQRPELFTRQHLIELRSPLPLASRAGGAG